MSLCVIGAGLGRTGTLSLKLALEHLGIAPCYHAMEIAATVRTSLPLWNDAIGGTADWDRIFEGYRATVDYPSCLFWRELMEHYPQAKIILTRRDPDGWFESVSETIFPAKRKGMLLGNDGLALSDFLRRDFGDNISDRTFMTNYFRRWNQSVIDEVPADRLLVLDAGEGWDPLCAFLGVACPEVAYPWLHARPKKSRWNLFQRRSMPEQKPEELEDNTRDYLDGLHQTTFR
ncbi:sulfotransferase family protein [Agrobacterium vitis]|uniref:sulfotransferase family protein n=1 Tax=Agrobacterium vitis TaxID=373 RepID=UPI0008725F4A|nr:sulfotransferase family protein [Agrobacterium vitis]MCE6077768.1 hypothetical protein [Agrobacterium vitis]MCM2453536.1 sulfotransferase [Agrobacterium vitis]MUO73131.1 hypothetical protein [Agrobacterium vitis]MUO86352.1 hypothetical protein [Agrobacterium vitis]MVA37237.1 hypothetical protein [Agrobacterium vitis]